MSSRRDPIGKSAKRWIKRYRRYRKVGTALNHKIIDALVDGDVIEVAARALGLGAHGQLILDSEDELSVLMDFALYEVRQEGKSLVEIYREQHGGVNHTERVLLDAMVEARTGLFLVEDIDPTRHFLTLRDVIGQREPLYLVDINFSRTVWSGLFFFFRPIQVEDFVMTSGVAFLFLGDVERRLRRTWEKAKDSADRYVRFFKLSKRIGVPATFV